MISARGFHRKKISILGAYALGAGHGAGLLAGGVEARLWEDIPDTLMFTEDLPIDLAGPVARSGMSDEQNCVQV